MSYPASTMKALLHVLGTFNLEIDIFKKSSEAGSTREKFIF